MKSLLREMGIKQCELSKRCNIHPTKLNRILNTNEPPTDEQIRRLCEYLNRDESELFSVDF